MATAEGDKGKKQYDVKGNVTITIEETAAPVESKPVEKPNYLANILFIALIFETILIVTFALGKTGGKASAQVFEQASLRSRDVCITIRTEINKILIRERNLSIINSESAANNENKLAWRLVHKVLDKIKGQIESRVKILLEEEHSVQGDSNSSAPCYRCQPKCS
jgi:hypothetical protein